MTIFGELNLGRTGITATDSLSIPALCNNRRPVCERQDGVCSKSLSALRVIGRRAGGGMGFCGTVDSW